METSFISHDPPGYSFANRLPPDQRGPVRGTTGCEALSFKPTIDVKPDSLAPDSPSGLSVELDIPQEGLSNPTGLATAHLKDARVTLPEGMTVSPSSASGLEGCSDAQIGIGTDSEVQCPDAAKIGSVHAETPILNEALDGGIYVGTQESDDPESGRMFRIFLVLKNKQRGLLVKLPGQIRIDKTTGRIETLFKDNPQLPVSRIFLQFKTGPRAPLAMPQSCGSKTVLAELSSWGGQTANLTSSFTIECPPDLGTFSPGFEAGTLVPTGGAFSPFVVRIQRPDRQQYLAGVSLKTPTGVLAKLRGVSLCSDASAAAGTCPAESHVGTATVAAGPGENPFYVKGPVSLTGPYKGAPYGLAVAVRAVAGPFDLGTVVVRQAVFVDPTDGHLDVVSDPLPTIIKGVPLRLRSINVDVDRPRFTLNPTSCAEKQIAATFLSEPGAVSTQSSRFQAGGCRSLGFSPRLTLALSGRKQIANGRHPGLKAVMTQGSGQAGIKNVAVALPLSLALDPENAASDTLCSFEDGLKREPKCPKSSIIGRAKAITPLLNRPLTGPVFFVKNERIDKRTGRRIRTLPTLLVALRGEVALNLRATTAVQNNRLVSKFTTVPDAPVSRFELALKGGKRGILVVTSRRSLCQVKQVADIAIGGQNGKKVSGGHPMASPCPGRR